MVFKEHRPFGGAALTRFFVDLAYLRPCGEGVLGPWPVQNQIDWRPVALQILERVNQPVWLASSVGGEGVRLTVDLRGAVFATE